MVLAPTHVYPPASFEAGAAPRQRGGWGARSQEGELTPADRRDIPPHHTSSSAHKSGEGEKEEVGGDTFGAMASVFPAPR